MNRSKWLSIALTAVLAGGLLTGCSAGGGGNAPQQTPQNAPVAEPPPQQEASEGLASGINATGMPIVNEPISLTFFTGKSPTNGNNFEETMLWTEYAKMTNINVKFELVPFENLTEKKNLALVSGDYGDAFYTARLTSDDLYKYGSQGVLIKLNDLIEEYAPNFKKLLDAYPDVKKGLTMPDGNIYSIPCFYDPGFESLLIGAPIWVNQDWLAQLGMKEPSTTEEFYEYLKAVSQTDLNGNGQHDEIPYSGESFSALLNHLKGAWGLGTRGLGHPFVDIDPETNELRFIKTDLKYKEMLEYVHRLYNEELLDKELFTIKSSALFAKGQEGILGATIVGNPATLMNQKNYVGLGALQGPHGDQLYSHVKTPLVHVGAFAITNKNEHPEATMRWIDYFFSEEGMKMFFMGFEGVTYEVAEDGSLQYVEAITNNLDGLTQDQALAQYLTWLGGSYPGFVTKKYFKGSESLPNALEVGEKASPHMVKEIWGKFNYLDEEKEIMSSIGSDIESYANEMEAKFVNGTVPFSEWDNYVATIEKMGLEKYMQTYRTAYERYNQGG